MTLKPLERTYYAGRDEDGRSIHIRVIRKATGKLVAKVLGYDDGGSVFFFDEAAAPIRNGRFHIETAGSTKRASYAIQADGELVSGRVARVTIHSARGNAEDIREATSTFTAQRVARRG